MKMLNTIAKFNRGQWNNTITVEVNDYNDKDTLSVVIQSIGTYYSTYTRIFADAENMVNVNYGAFDTYNLLPCSLKMYIDGHAKKWMQTAQKIYNNAMEV